MAYLNLFYSKTILFNHYHLLRRLPSPGLFTWRSSRSYNHCWKAGWANYFFWQT